MNILGFDIGGTKCAVIFGTYEENIKILDKKVIPTDLTVTPEIMIERLCGLADGMINDKPADAVGISCGGPLNSTTGVIQGPPNLPGWNNVPIVDLLKSRYSVPVHLQNDANACAVAEWKFGNGRGCRNMIFMTFGTGLGAGLILNGQLYSGTSDMAGEAGHMRLERFGPVGYGKSGSFEGFCSGGGLSQLGYSMAMEALQNGICPRYFTKGMQQSEVTAKSIADAAENGDETALRVYETCGEYLGRGLSILIDILNPEKIIIGSIFARSQNLLWDSAKRVIEKEALPLASSCCQVLPAGLMDQIGDYAALATALL